jgi:hypothetical protein
MKRAKMITQKINIQVVSVISLSPRSYGSCCLITRRQGPPPSG